MTDLLRRQRYVNERKATDLSTRGFQYHLKKKPAKRFVLPGYKRCCVNCDNSFASFGISFTRQLFCICEAMKPFDIAVDTPEGLRYFDVIPNVIGENAQFEIWENKKHFFSLECCFDKAGDALKLSPGFVDKGIDLKLVEAVAEIIRSEEE